MPADTKIQRYKVNVEYSYQVPVWNSIGESSFKSTKSYYKARRGVLKASKINQYLVDWIINSYKFRSYLCFGSEH